MKCPKCGTYNTEADQYCSACNQPLLPDSSLPEPIQPASAETTKKVSKISLSAIASPVLGIIGIVTFKMSFGILGWIGMVFGIFALYKIEESHGRLRGEAFAIIGIIISTIVAIFSWSTYNPLSII